MKSYHNGLDVFYTAPGKHDKMSCRVCADEMEAHRNVNGPTNFASAMAKHKTLHDAFYCPNAGKAWHNQAIALKEEMEKTASTRLAKLLREELGDVLKTRKATKKVNMW